MSTGARYARVPVRAAADRALSETTLRVLIALAAHQNDTSAWVWPSFAALAELTGIDRRHLSAAVKHLERAGYIEARRGEKGRSLGRYRIIFSAEKSPDDVTSGAEKSPPGVTSHDAEKSPPGVTEVTSRRDKKSPHGVTGRTHEQPKEEPKGRGRASTPRPSPTAAASQRTEPRLVKEPKGTRLSEGMSLPPDWKKWAAEEGHPDPEKEWAKFHDYWIGKSGANATKANWQATWRNWIRRSLEDRNNRGDKKFDPGSRVFI